MSGGNGNGNGKAAPVRVAVVGLGYWGPNLVRNLHELPIADVAAVCGYYDQSHLTRDFAELAGTPPGEWLASEHGSVEPDADVIRLDRDQSTMASTNAP